MLLFLCMFVCCYVYCFVYMYVYNICLYVYIFYSNQYSEHTYSTNFMQRSWTTSFLILIPPFILHPRPPHPPPPCIMWSVNKKKLPILLNSFNKSQLGSWMRLETLKCYPFFRLTLFHSYMNVITKFLINNILFNSFTVV